MRWQEAVFLVGGWALAAALIPTVLANAPPPLSTSLLTGTVLSGYTATFIQQKQYVSAVGIAANALLWWVLAWQGV